MDSGHGLRHGGSMSMSPRALTAVAVLTAVLAGRVSAQYPPDAAPLAGLGGAGPFYAGGQPDFGPGPMPGGPPGMMPGAPMMGGPGMVEGPVLATDSLGGAGGAHGPRAWFGAEYLLYWTKHA